MSNWSQIKDPDINPHTYEHIIFGKEAKIIKWKKKAPSTNDAGCLHIKECRSTPTFLLTKVQMYQKS